MCKWYCALIATAVAWWLAAGRADADIIKVETVATATYTSLGIAEQTTSSPLVVEIVDPTVAVSPSGASITADETGTICLPHIITNRDTHADTIEVSAGCVGQAWPATVVLDEDGDGVRDPQEHDLVRTLVLGPQVSVPVLLAVTIPLDAQPGADADVTLVAASRQADGGSARAVDTFALGALRTDARAQLVALGIGPGWHMVSLPADPVNHDPRASLPIADGDPTLFAHITLPDGDCGYETAQPGLFGQVAMHEGYWLLTQTDATISYLGVPSSAARTEVSLPVRGWTLIGHPYDRPVALSQCTVRDTRTGVEVSLDDAAQLEWLSPPFYTFDDREIAYVSVWPDRDLYQDDALRPWCGYWVDVKRNDLALVVPQPAS